MILRGAHDAVGEYKGATRGEVERHLIGAQAADLDADEPARKVLAGIEPDHILPVRELVQPGARAEHGDRERTHELGTVAVMVAVGEHNRCRLDQTLGKPRQTHVGWDHRIDQNAAVLEPVRGDRDMDPGVDRGPVINAGQHLSH